MTDGEWIETDVPQRMDRLPWSGWHWLIVVALGITWILDGLETTLAGALGGILKDHATLGLTDVQVGASSSFYLSGAVIGALVFGYGTDRLGRKKLFYVTLLFYLCATAATAFSWNFASYAFFRALTGAGIGGEYAAINSAVDELIPARRRRAGRPHHQLDLLGRRDARFRRDGLFARPALPADPARVAVRVRHRARCSGWPCCSSGTGSRKAPAG